MVIEYLIISDIDKNVTNFFFIVCTPWHTDHQTGVVSSLINPIRVVNQLIHNFMQWRNEEPC